MRFRLLLAPIAFASLAVGCGHDRPSVPAGAIAVVGDREVARSDYAALMSRARQSYRSRGRTFPAEGTAAYAGLRSTAVRLLVERAELDQEAPKLGVDVADGRVAARRRLLIDESFAGSVDRYRRHLSRIGMTDAQVRAALRAQLLSDALFQAVTAGVRVGTPAVKRYYEQHLAAYTTPRSRAIRHILVRTEALAEDVHARLRAGASFAALARRLSRDTSTRAGGGRLVLVEGRTEPTLDPVAFGLAAGAVSRPFPTAFGWELVQALGPVRPLRTTPFASVREAIRRRLLEQQRARRFSQWLADVHEKFASRTAYASGFAPANGG